MDINSLLCGCYQIFANGGLGHSGVNSAGASLADLFRPPVDIMFPGTFKEVCVCVCVCVFHLFD